MARPDQQEEAKEYPQVEVIDSPQEEIIGSQQVFSPGLKVNSPGSNDNIWSSHRNIVERKQNPKVSWQN